MALLWQEVVIVMTTAKQAMELSSKALLFEPAITK